MSIRTYVRIWTAIIAVQYAVAAIVGFTGVSM
jgi:hypothetical protein